MKAQELRVGNLFIDKLTGSQLIVSELKCDTDLKSNNVVVFTVKNRDIFPLPDGWQAEPILLNEHFLVKLGAKKFDGGFIIDRFRLLHKLDYGYYYVIDKQTNVYFSKVEFVHEWQNLFFAMNGE